MSKKSGFDDGRVIADMSAPGIGKRWDKKSEQAVKEQAQKKNSAYPGEIRRTVLAAILVSLLTAAAFIGAAALFILFCTKVWLR